MTYNFNPTRLDEVGSKPTLTVVNTVSVVVLIMETVFDDTLATYSLVPTKVEERGEDPTVIAVNTVSVEVSITETVLSPQ